MPKPSKCRIINGMPDQFAFSPTDKETPKDSIVMSLDEFETIRLLDYNGLTQEQCAKLMGVARTTITAMYENARKKIACMLVEGKSLVISGGNVKFDIPNNIGFQCSYEKGENVMRLAVTYDNGEIFQHFGHTEQFKVYDIKEGQILNTEIVDTNGQGHGALAGFLLGGNVDALICGGIGGGAQMALSNAGIMLYAGVSGNADEAVKAFLAGELLYTQNPTCNHHSHEDGHSCGSGEAHSCGHSCH